MALLSFSAIEAIAFLVVAIPQSRRMETLDIAWFELVVKMLKRGIDAMAIS